MRRRIDQLVNGIYEYEAPEILFSAERMEAEIPCGGSHFGNFTLQNREQKRMKGFLYSSDARVACEPGEFSGIEPRISYSVDVCGMYPGDVLEGTFTVCTDAGEAELPFRFVIEERQIALPEGMPSSLEGFAAFAKEDDTKAYRIFGKAAFRTMLAQTAPEYEALYQGLFSRTVDLQSMEEFLTATGQKAPVRFQLKKERGYFADLKADAQEVIEIVRSDWGFQKLDVSADAAFLIPARTRISTEDFLGKTFRLEYLIDAGALHEGKNFGRIMLKNEAQTLYYEVTVQKEAAVRERELHMQKQAVEQLYTDYLAFRLKQLNIHSWTDRAAEAFARYEQAGGRSVMVKLYQAQIAFALDQSDEACAILQKLERKKAFAKNPAARGYFEYLTTFSEQDVAYVDEIQEEVEELYLKNQEEWTLQWILLYMKETYIQHPTKRLEAIRRQFRYGCRSRLMYLEAYFVLEKAPLLLKKLDEFEIRVLRFMCRNDLLNKEIVMQVADLAGRWKHYDQALYQILCHCHTKYASRSVVNAICSLLIKGHKAGAAYFNWYEKGVAEGLRLTGLYEAYIESMGKERGGLLPQMIRMYFSYENTILNYEKKAVLYANIIANKGLDARTFEAYRPTIEKFMIDQLMAGRVNRELACIYETFLTKNMLNRKMAENLARSFFVCEIRCCHENAAGVAVVHRQLEEIQRVYFIENTAEVQIYTEDAWIFIIDKKGRWHADAIPYTVTRVMDSEKLFAMCRELIPDSPGFLLHFCSEAQRKKEIQGRHMKDFCGLLEYADIKEGYKRQIRQDILDYFYAHPQDETLFGYLHLLDLDELMHTDQKKTLELMVSEGMWQEAFALVCKYGPERMDTGALVRLCSRCIVEWEKEENEMLLYLCEYCFCHGKYDETVLEYLAAGYDGPVERMKALWSAAHQFGLDTFVLEEKIFLMLLFVRKGMEGTEEIFASYKRKFGRNYLIDGYLNLMAYTCFVKEMPVGDAVFEEIAARMEKGQKLDLSCRLALLQYDTRSGAAEERRARMLPILQECRRSGRSFAFFAELPSELKSLLQFQEKSFIEYRANPKANVTLHYTIKNPAGFVMQERSEMMHNVYEGIYVKEFTLFYGEKLTYSITEEYNGTTVQSGRCLIQAGKVEKDGEGIQGKYHMLNEMCRSLLEHRESRWKKQAEEYLQMEEMVSELFPLP